MSLSQNAIELLKKLIATPSVSKEEDNTAAIIFEYLVAAQTEPKRYLNNVWVKNRNYDAQKPTVLLNSHHDTVKPNPQYTLDPFSPIVEDGKLFGLGSNDAGGCLVSLIALFLHFYERTDLPFNLVMAATAEEEISGKNGIEALLQAPDFLNDLAGSTIQLGIVGEPTLMQMAIAERGLLVLDGVVEGKAGHAAREEGINALYLAMSDIQWFQSYRFERISEVLGPVKMNVTVVETENKAHNMIPATCRYVVDVRVNERYTFDEVLATIRANVKAAIQPRSTRLKSSGIALEHPIVQSGLDLGRTYYGSPTTSDKALMPFTTLKMGPGDSARSHSANEFVFLSEIESGIELYIQLLEKYISKVS